MFILTTKVDEGGLPCYELKSIDNLNSVKIFTFGATVTSWLCDGKERLYLSDSAIFNGVKAIRGGIPVVFPQFGSPPNASLPQHGFARNSVWELFDQTLDSTHASLTMVLKDNETIYQAWPHRFQLLYKVTLTPNDLKCSLFIHNSATDINEVFSFDCQALLHTYIRVPDIAETAVVGFQNQPYVDKLITTSTDTYLSAIDDREKAFINKEVDRIYSNIPNSALLNNDIIPNSILVQHNSTPFMEINQFGSYYSNIKTEDMHTLQLNYNVVNTTELGGHHIPVDTVFWNPWIDKTASIADLPNDAYHSFLCIEPGLVSKWFSLKPSDVIILSQQLTAK
eukprot:gene4887-6845_t